MDKHIHQHMKDTMENKFIPMTSVTSGHGQTVSSDIYCLPIQIVNVCFIGNPENSNEWVLIDAGMPKSSNRIIKEAKERFGSNHKPKAVILTHGHFDHVGAIVNLVEAWDVPVYAHELEIPYLTGKAKYPQPDGTVEGGLIAKMSPFFPNEPVDLGTHVKSLPEDGNVPEMPGWRWIHTHGHTPGHVSLFRDEDRSLIAGDAFINVKQESLFKVLSQHQEISGPPSYFTTDWQSAWESVKKIEALHPDVAVTGHGRPMSGETLSIGLEKLVKEFDRIAIPDSVRYGNRKH